LAVLESVTDNGVYVARTPVLAIGRIELLWYLSEQSLSADYHRYGNLGDRAGENVTFSDVPGLVATS
jgi:RHH-type proline utilization regulon transcriptional repressor/proline dehydrogenase/delta 1-pyrroline-5-carboxylate dehydrogenase